MRKNAFTLVELLVVVAVMGLLGTLSVGSYRAMRRGMADKAAMENTTRFMRAACQRSLIDRTPVDVYFWNELVKEGTDASPAIVVGKAVAVRRAGRISSVSGMYLVDEFGDLRFKSLVYDEDADNDEATSSSDRDGVYLYSMAGGGDTFARSRVAVNTVRRVSTEPLLQLGKNAKIPGYAYVVVDPGGVTWKSGDAYGCEFAQLELPRNYTFGSSGQIPTSINSPIYNVQRSRFWPSGAASKKTVQVCSRSTTGEMKTVGTSDDPTREEN